MAAILRTIGGLLTTILPRSRCIEMALGQGRHVPGGAVYASERAWDVRRNSIAASEALRYSLLQKSFLISSV